MAGKELHDPIKDLMADIEREESAAGGAKEETAEDEAELEASAEDDKEGSEEEPEEETSEEDESEGEKKPAVKAKAEEKPEKKPKERYVPVGRVNEETAKRRKAESRVSELEAENAELTKAAKEGRQPVSEEERKRIMGQAQTAARVQVRAEAMVDAGYEQYGHSEFDAASQVLADLGAPDHIILMALEATGSPTAAAKAIFNLAQEDAEEIERIFKSTPFRIAARLDQLSKTRQRRSEQEEEDDSPQRRQAVKPTKAASKAPAPVRTVRGSAKVDSNEINDELSEDDFTDRFERMMDNSAKRHNRAH